MKISNQEANIKCKYIHSLLIEFITIVLSFRNGIKYSGEAHFVYSNPQTDQLAVLALFIQSNQNGSATNHEWNKYITTAAKIGISSDSLMVGLNLASLMGNNLNEFWRFQGSLTTPPCTEGVVWTVFRKPLILNDSYVDLLRQNTLPKNDRNTQPLYNRIVYRSFINETISNVPDYQCCTNNSNNSANLHLSILMKCFILILCFVSIIVIN